MADKAIESIPGADAARVAELLDQVIRTNPFAQGTKEYEALHLARRIVGRHTIAVAPELASSDSEQTQVQGKAPSADVDATEAHPKHGIAPTSPNRGLHAVRLRNDPSQLETAFAKQWEAECRGRSCVSGGWGTLDLLVTEPSNAGEWLGLGQGARKPLLAIDDSHRIVAATVVQWLGTGAGRSFLVETFRAAGYAMTYERQPKREGEPCRVSTNACKLAECQGKPRCGPCVGMDRLYGCCASSAP